MESLPTAVKLEINMGDAKATAITPSDGERAETGATSERLRDQDEQRSAALAIAGRFRSGLTDVGKRHDHYLTDDYGD